MIHAHDNIDPNLKKKIRRFIPPIISLALFMETVDSTIINTAIPKMAESLHVNPIDLKVALIGYLLSLAIFIPISGWMADKFGLKKVFVFALCIFTLSSLACGFSDHLAELVIARIFQGIGGSFMMPLGRLMVVQWYDKSEFIQAMNRIVMLALIGPALGPFLGGVITQLFSWHWIFWINIPLGIICIICTIGLLPDKDKIQTHSLDMMGFMLFGMGLAGASFGLSTSSENVFTLPQISVIFTSSFLLLILYFFHSRRQSHPILDNHLFIFRTFRIAVLGNLIARMGIGAVPFLLPLMLQIQFHLSPIHAGLFVAATPIGMFGAKMFSKKILTKLKFKKMLLLNTLFLSIIIATLSFHSSSISAPMDIFLSLHIILFGFLMSLQFSGMNPLVFSELNDTEFSSATSIHSTVMQLSQSFGVAICALILKNFHMNFTLTFISMGIMTLCANFIFLQLKKEDGINLI